MGRASHCYHLLLPSISRSNPDVQETTRGRLLRCICPCSHHRQCYYMADLCRQYVLHHESIGWPGITWCRLWIHQRTLFQVHRGRHHPLLFISLVHQDLVPAFLQASRQESKTSGALMVACVWHHRCNIFRLYWHHTILMPPSVI